MSVTEGLHKGMVIRHEGQFYTVLDFHGMQKGNSRRPSMSSCVRSARATPANGP